MSGEHMAVRSILLKPMALPTSIKRRPGQVGIKAIESHMRVIEREAGAPAVGENDRFAVQRESA